MSPPIVMEKNMSPGISTEKSMVQMPYEDVLPYPDFTVHLREHALYRLPEVLDAIINTQGQVCVCVCEESQSAPTAKLLLKGNVGYLHCECTFLTYSAAVGVNRDAIDTICFVVHAGEAHAIECVLRLEVFHMAGPAGESAGCPHVFLASEDDRGKAHTIHGLGYLHFALRHDMTGPGRPAPDVSNMTICVCSLTQHSCWYMCGSYIALRTSD